MIDQFNIIERFKKLSKDEVFKYYCYKLSEELDANKDIEFIEKIAKIDISKYDYDENLIVNQHSFSNEQIKQNTIKFYKMLDEYYPGIFNSVKQVEKNFNYLQIENNSDKRSYCACGPNKHILVNLESRIGDTGTMIHEMGHSLAKTFTLPVSYKDESVSEIPTLILDKLSSLYMQKQYPELKNNLIENDKFSEILSVLKARESLMDKIIIDIMTNKQSLDSAIKEYGNLYQDNQKIIDNCLHRIEIHNFDNFMLESKYLLPNVISISMAKKFETNPSLVVMQLKKIISQCHDCSQEDILQICELQNRQELVDNYIKCFDSRMKNYCKKENEKQQEQV